MGGNYGPYKQSERGEIYAKYIKKLLEKGRAYYCFCSEEEIEERRQYLKSIGRAPIYSGKCYQLSKEEVAKRLSEGKHYVIRLRVSEEKISFKDRVRGKIEFDTAIIGDFVIARDENRPLYHFAVVVDDFEMKITHVIRGEDHISNTPKHILIQKALGIASPFYAHLPLILGSDRSKLSKRHGDTAVREYIRQGYLPEALVNFIVFLGWNPGTDREIYTLPALIKDFSFSRVHKGGAIFNLKRLDWLNGFYIRQKTLEKITELCLPYLIETSLIEPIFKEKQYPPAYGGQTIVQAYNAPGLGREVGLAYIQKTIVLYQERLKKLSEISELTGFFFKEKLEYKKEMLFWKEAKEKETKDVFDKMEKLLSKVKDSDWTKENIQTQLTEIGDDFENRGYVLWPFRVALSAKQASAGPFEIAEVLGKEMCLKRIKEAKTALK